MADVAVYQIGLGSFGRYGFEKFIEMHNHLEEADLELKGLCERDPEKRKQGLKFAEANGIDIDIFDRPQDMYEAARKEDVQVMVYDAGPTASHADHIYMSMQNGFYHLAEKPPSMNRDQHLKEKELAEKKDVAWTVDFIERESPVVKKALEIVEGTDIESIQVFRESSMGVEKILNPAERSGVLGGDIIDKMIHEVYVLDLVESSGREPALELESAHNNYFLPKRIDSEKLMSIYGGYTEEINEDTATAQAQAVFDADGVKVSLNSSWVGMSQRARAMAEMVREKTGAELIETEYKSVNDSVFLDEEARFFITKGEIRLAGDMLHGRLYDLETGEEVGTDYYIHDQLYRVIEKAVLNAVGQEDMDVDEKETDEFINAIFDVRDAVLDGDYMYELEKSNDRLRELLLTDDMFEEDEKATG